MTRVMATVLALAFLGVGSTAEAARWKTGHRPVGTTYQERQAFDGQWCHYTTAESGTDQCRYKFSDGCKWYYGDSGTSQCTPPTLNLAPATLTASNGSITITPIDDRDGNRATMLANLKMKYAKTGDTLTMQLYVRASTSTLTSLATPRVVARTPTPLTVLPADSKYAWNVLKYTTTTGTTMWRTQADQKPVPPTPPPGGYTCGVAWQQFMGSQVTCYGQWAGTAILVPFYEAAKAAYYGNAKCGTALLTGLIGEAAYFQCLGGFASWGFAYSILDNAFGIGSASTAGGVYHSMACNSIAQSRMAMYRYCSPVLP